MNGNRTFETMEQLSRHALRRPAVDCSETDILACDIYSTDGDKLVSALTIVTDYVKSLLELNKINMVTVYTVDRPHSNVQQIQCYRQLCNIRKIVTELSAGFSLECNKILKLLPGISQEISLVQFQVISECLKHLQQIDHYSYTHSKNVGVYSLLLARWLGMSNSGCATALQAGLLHDIGKTEIPESILKKAAALTTEEFELIKRHPIYSYMRLIDCPAVCFAVKQAVLQHHERLDKSGYPLAVDDINTYAKIIAIADVYDAMTTNRVYKKGVTPFKAFEFFQQQGREMFEPIFIKVFIENMSSLLVGATVQTTSGDTGRIVYSPPAAPFKPVIDQRSIMTSLMHSNQVEIAKISI